jgi:hypothetical protein
MIPGISVTNYDALYFLVTFLDVMDLFLNFTTLDNEEFLGLIP